MLYYRCVTCGTDLANRVLIWEPKREEICNSKATEAEKDKKKQELLDTLNLPEMCCRMRMLTYLKKVEIVK